jgi:hypothetical protein
MTTYDLAEAIADATIDYIEGAQTVKLAEVDARYTTAVGLREFTVRLGDIDQEREPIDAYPLLYVSPIKAEIVASVGGLSRSALVTNSFSFIVIAYGTDTTSERPAESMKRALMRYAVAVLEMLVEGQAAEGWTWEWGTGGTTQVQYRTYQTPSAYLGVAAIETTVDVAEVA